MAFLAQLAQGYDFLTDATLSVMFNEVVGSVSVVAGRRADSNALRFASGGSYVGTMGQEMGLGDVGLAEYRAVKITSFSSGYVTLCSWYSDPALSTPGTPGPFTRLFSIRIYFDGSVAFYKGATLIGATAAGAFPFDSYVRLEDAFVVTLVAVFTTGYNAIRINGTDYLSISPTDNNESAAGRRATYVRYGHLDAGTASPDPVVEIDDYCVHTHATNANNPAPFLTSEDVNLAPANADIRVRAFLPNGVGAFSQWTPLAGSNYENVDEPLVGGIDSDTSYVRCANVAASFLDTYAWQSFNPGGLSSVLFCTHWLGARREASPVSGPTLSHYYRYTDDAAAVTTNSWGGPGGVSVWTGGTNYRYWPTSQRLTPAGEAWTPTRLGRMEWGADGRPTATNAWRLSHTVVEAAWTALAHACTDALLAAPGLTALYLLDETTAVAGEAVLDSAGANHGEVVGSTITPEQAALHCAPGSSFRFDGAFVEVAGGIPALDDGGDFTFFAWIRRDDGPGTAGLDFSICDRRTVFGGALSGGAALFVDDLDQLTLTIYDGTSPSPEHCVSTTPILNGIEYFVAGTWDGSTSRVYVNGQPAGSLATTQTPPVAVRPFYIGKDTVQPAAALGRIDNVGVCDVALSDAEILALYNACKCVTAKQRSRAYLLTSLGTLAAASLAQRTRKAAWC